MKLSGSFFYTVLMLVEIAVLVLLGVNLYQNPVGAQRIRFENDLTQLVAPEFTMAGVDDPEADTWRDTVSSTPSLWQPLTKPKAQAMPAPNLAQMLAGVDPTRNQMGSGATLKVQIRVDGGREWYTAGQQIKGCTIKEIQPSGVLFSVIQNGQEYVITLQRR